MRFARVPASCQLGVTLLLAWSMPAAAGAPPVLRRAEVAVAYTAPTVCDVAITVEIGEAAEVEHRLELLAGTEVERLEVTAGRVIQEATDIGRTRSLRVAPARVGAAYSLRYRVTQTPEHAHRCPLWLPTTPADGRSRRVQLVVTVPDGAEASATMPAFAWTGPRGTATLPHLPAIVIVPFARVGEPRPWDISRAMDLTALATLVGSTALWLRRQRGGR